MSVLVYGGLYGSGLALVNKFIESGVEVIGISAAQTDEEREVDENNELLFGRNALFTPCHNPDVSLAYDIEYFYVADNRFFLNDGKQDLRKERLKHVLNLHLPETDQCNVIVLSSLDIYGEPFDQIDEDTPLKPDTKVGRAAKILEEVMKDFCTEKTNRGIQIIRTNGFIDYEYRNDGQSEDQPLWLTGLMRAKDLKNCGVGIYNIFENTLKASSEENQLSFNDEKAKSAGLI